MKTDWKQTCLMHEETISGLIRQRDEALHEAATRKLLADARLGEASAAQTAARAAKKDADDARAEHNDLKERLAAAELENARLRGYIARVQEDDVVREELVKVGDPEGEQHLVPKRKPTVFNAPDQYASAPAEPGDQYRPHWEIQQRPRRHWVTY